MIRTNAHALNFLSSSSHERVIQFGMSGIQCPRCGREAAGGGRFWRDAKPYCPACGWNIDRANTLGGKNQKILAVYFVGIAVVLCLVGVFAATSAAGSRNPHLGRFVAFAIVLTVLAVISWHRSKSQKSAQMPGTTTTASPSFNTFNAPSNPVHASYERLQMLRRPRSIRLKTSMRIFVAVYLIVLASATYSIFIVAQRGGAKPGFTALPNLIPLVMFGLIWSIVAATMFRSILRDRSLLTDGEIAIGTVTSQSYAGGENRESRIVYEFKDAAGRTISGKCADRTRKLFEEMQTPVFYDPTNPTKNVALAGATYDLVET
jgi:uncharacterized protein (DUF983 family)